MRIQANDIIKTENIGFDFIEEKHRTDLFATTVECLASTGAREAWFKLIILMAVKITTLMSLY